MGYYSIIPLFYKNNRYKQIPSFHVESNFSSFFFLNDGYHCIISSNRLCVNSEEHSGGLDRNSICIPSVNERMKLFYTQTIYF